MNLRFAFLWSVKSVFDEYGNMVGLQVTGLSPLVASSDVECCEEDIWQCGLDVVVV